MAELGKAIDRLNQIKLSDKQVYEYIDALFPLVDNASPQQRRNLLRLKEDAGHPEMENGIALQRVH